MSKRQPLDQKQILRNLNKDFNEIVSNRSKLRQAADRFLENVIDEITLGVIFDTHRVFKCGIMDIQNEDDTEDPIDLNAPNNNKKTISATCQVCDQSMAATRFAGHLANCMNLGRTTRTKRRVATDNKDKDFSYSEIPSDDENDDKAIKKKERTITKKSKGTPKKGQGELLESTNVDVEGGDSDDLNFLKDIHIDYYSNNTSPVDSVNSSSSNSSKKRDKSKNRKHLMKDRSSPNSINLD